MLKDLLYIVLTFLIYIGIHAQAAQTTSLCQKEIITQVLTRYHRPFTFLKIGHRADYIIEQIAPVYPDSVFVMIGENQGASYDNTICLNHQLTFQEAQNLASCEHIDVLLLNDSCSFFYKQWKETISIFQQAIHVIIIEVPKDTTEALEEMHHYLSEVLHGDFYESASSIYYILENKEPFRLIKTTLIHPRKTRWTYEIYCDYHHKYLKKIRPDWTATSPWIPGINMMTYLMLNGTTPSRQQVLDLLPIDQNHSDWVPNNMIIQGRDILLIDQDDPISTPVTPDGGRRFRDMEAKLRSFILTTSDLSPSQVRETFISIYNWGTYFDQTEIEE